MKVNTQVYAIGMVNPQTKVEVTNRQGCVEYKTLEGYCTEEEIRSTVGNIWKDVYEFYYKGYYSDRKQAIDRMTSELDQAKKKVEDLEFAIKVTKKRNWEQKK